MNSYTVTMIKRVSISVEAESIEDAKEMAINTEQCEDIGFFDNAVIIETVIRENP